jgi:hypothetical protein
MNNFIGDYLKSLSLHQDYQKQTQMTSTCQFSFIKINQKLFI